jgi:Ulp1 family protease
LKKKHNLANLKPFVRPKKVDEEKEEEEDQEDRSGSKVQDVVNEEEEDGTVELGSEDGEEPEDPHTDRISNLNLKFQHKQILQSCEYLDDTIIDAALMLLRKQSPEIQGLESPLVLAAAHGAQDLRPPIIQIHHDSSRSHWITSSSIRGTVEVCDSLRKRNAISKTLKTQLRHTYAHLYEEQVSMDVRELPCDQQENTYDCGLHAIATAVQIAHAKDPTCTFDKSRMRSHLLDCFIVENLTSFTIVQKKIKRTKERSVDKKDLISKHQNTFF